MLTGWKVAFDLADDFLLFILPIMPMYTLAKWQYVCVRVLKWMKFSTSYSFVRCSAWKSGDNVIGVYVYCCMCVRMELISPNAPSI